MSRTLVILALLLCSTGLLQARDAVAGDRLKKQDIYPVGLWIGPSLPEHRGASETKAAESHVFKLAAAGAQALMCEYEVIDEDGKSYAYVNLWYQSVGASQSELVAVSKGHPLALLGDRAFAACPSRTVASRYAQDSLLRFRKLAAGMDPDDSTPLAPREPAPGELVGCAYIEDVNIEGRFLLVNRCTFAVNVKYCGSSPGVKNPGRKCLPTIPQFVQSGQRFLLKLPLSERARWMACRHPEIPVATWVKEPGPGHYRWSCE